MKIRTKFQDTKSQAQDKVLHILFIHFIKPCPGSIQILPTVSLAISLKAVFLNQIDFLRPWTEQGILVNGSKWYRIVQKPSKQITTQAQITTTSRPFLRCLPRGDIESLCWKPITILFCFIWDPKNGFISNLNERTWTRESHMLFTLTQCKFIVCLIGKEYRNVGLLS